MKGLAANSKLAPPLAVNIATDNSKEKKTVQTGIENAWLATIVKKLSMRQITTKILRMNIMNIDRSRKINLVSFSEKKKKKQS